MEYNANPLKNFIVELRVVCPERILMRALVGPKRVCPPVGSAQVRVLSQSPHLGFFHRPSSRSAHNAMMNVAVCRCVRDGWAREHCTVDGEQTEIQEDELQKIATPTAIPGVWSLGPIVTDCVSATDWAYEGSVRCCCEP